MKVSEAFLVNTKNFDAIIDALVEYEDEDPIINSDLLEKLGYSDPNDLLVVRLLKDLNIIDNDGSPGKYYSEFQNPETTKKALGRGLLEAYEPIFESYPELHKETPDNIREAFEEVFEGKKTDLIIKYISGTFHKIVTFVGTNTIDALRYGGEGEKNRQQSQQAETEQEKQEQEQEQEAEVASVKADFSEINGNGSPSPAASGGISSEEIGDTDFDKFVSNIKDVEDIEDEEGDGDGDNQDEIVDEPVAEEENDDFVAEDTDLGDEDSASEVTAAESEEETADEPTEEDSRDIADEFVKNNLEKANKKKKEEQTDYEEDDPFAFEDSEQEKEEEDHAPSQQHQHAETKSEIKEEVDNSPIDLNIPMMEATQTTPETMKNLNTERAFVQKALLRKADLLHKMERWDELVPTLEEIIKRYDNEESLNLQEAVSRSIIRRALALLKLDRKEEALPALNTVIKRFKDSEKEEFYNQASKAMLFKVQLLEEEGSTELLPLYNSIIDRMDDNSDPRLEKQLDAIHCKRYDLIVEDGGNQDVLDASRELIDRFKNTQKHQDYLQKAMMNRAELLDEMNRDEEALEAYDEFLEAFGSME